MNRQRVAKYIRLSREDGDDRESESVENQRDIIDNYISGHEELIEAGEYVDDGYTGTNFNRPSFQKMLNDIADEKIDCIITKDLSRFGRDHIDTGYYLERYLPANNIRYIAIGDNVNDKTMLENAGVGIAMDNSAPYIKEMADDVTLDNNADGVALAIEKYVIGFTE